MTTETEKQLIKNLEKIGQSLQGIGAVLNEILLELRSDSKKKSHQS